MYNQEYYGKVAYSLYLGQDLKATEIGNNMGVTRAYVYNLLKAGPHISDNFVSIMEEIGYDIEVRFVKKEIDGEKRKDNY